MDHAAPAPPRSWFARNWLWVVPVGCLLPVMCCGGLITTTVVAAFGLVKSSGAYTQSLATVSQNAQVQGLLGTPIESGFLVTGSVNMHNDAGDADISYKVSGPQGSGTVHAVAVRSNSQWTFTKLEFRDAAGAAPPIDLLAGP